MARKKKTEEYNVIDDIVQNHGAILLKDVGSSNYFVDTGNLSLNYICSGRFIDGGIAGGKITEIYGPPASSKSLVGMSILHGAQQMGGYAIFLDCEHGTNRDFAVAAAHVDPEKLVVCERGVETIERVFLKIHNIIKKIRDKKGPDVPIVFIYDSIGVSPCDREYKEIDLPEDYKKKDFDKIVGRHEQPGERARIAGKELRKIAPVLDRENATLFVVNQVRKKIGVLFGSPDAMAGGGEALTFYASCRLRVAPQKVIKHTKLEIPIGINVKIENKKNRSFSPHWQTEGVKLYFDSGINPLGGLRDIFLKIGRIEEAPGQAMYKVKEPWAEGREITFKSTKEENSVPPELLLDCPPIIDAESKEQVEQYLSAFGEAIRLTNSDDVKEANFAKGGNEELDGEEEE
jgi:RecA/RadA recombinase